MNIGKALFAVFSLAAVSAPAAQASEYRTFTQEGVTYKYRVIEKGDSKVIVGTSRQLGETKNFSLRVKDGKVRGAIAGRSVAFATTDANARNIQLAAD